MDIQTYMNKWLEKSEIERKQVAKNITIGELIKKIEKCSQDKDINFDFCLFAPTNFVSYRGYYSDLSIEYKEFDFPSVKVSDFLNKLKNILGSELIGYKGGEFLMEENTLVWASNYGECRDTAVVGVRESEHRVIIETAYVGD